MGGPADVGVVKVHWRFRQQLRNLRHCFQRHRAHMFKIVAIGHAAFQNDPPSSEGGIVCEGSAVNKLIQSVTISMVKNTQILKITATTTKPSLSAEIANTMADVFIESHLQAKLDMTEKATRFLTNSLDGLQQKLQLSEKALSEFYEENQVVNLDGVVGLAATELEQLNKQLLEAQTSLEFNSLIYKQTRAGVSIESLARIPEVLNHPLIQDIRREESRALTKVSELAKTYGPKHPTMISAQAELDAIQETFERQIDSLISSIATQYTVSQERVTNLQQEVSEAKARFRRLAARYARKARPVGILVSSGVTPVPKPPVALVTLIRNRNKIAV